MYFRNFSFYGIFFLIIVLPDFVSAQDNRQSIQDNITDTPVREQVDVRPDATDSEIRNRLSGILTSTGWFIESEVEVNDGVVFLRGSTETDDFKRWAGELARNTQDVTAVVNQIQVVEPDIWNYEPAFIGMQELWHSIMRSVPFWIFGLIVIILFWGLSFLVAKISRTVLKKREMNSLLRGIISRGIAVMVFLLGLYIVFYIADLTNVALTLLGGTGLLGIVLGIAFREITENFLASIFLSIQNPFHAGDLVEINGTVGFVQSLTVRATLLMKLDGNHIQIPNSTVYKSSILNFTSNPNQRTTFMIGIDYKDSIATAQEIGAKILAEHPAVLKEPEPWVLVDQLAASTVNIQFYFWVNAQNHNPLKVKSSLLRLVKSAYLKGGISIPDDVREFVIQNDVPVQISGKSTTPATVKDKKAVEKKPTEDSKMSVEGEGGLESNDEEIRNQARQSRSPEEGEDLLKP